MFDKVLSIVKERDFVVPKLLLLNYKDIGITEQELVVLIYLLNSDSNLYNPKDISNDLKLELVDVLTLVSAMTEKGLLNIIIESKSNKKAEVIDLNPLYEKLSFALLKEKEEDTTIYSVIESEFARSLSPLEYSLINAWLDAGYTEEIITEALKEAIYNNVTSLKYIDKILDDWHKKGIKTKEDVLNNKKKFKERKNNQKDSFDYDWLNEE